MKQIDLWQNFLIEKLSLTGDKVYKSQWANDYIEADKVAEGFFKGLRKKDQCIMISKIE